MRLCFDATRFGGGLNEAIELAAERGVPAIEYSFAPFKTTAKGGAVKGKEKAYLEQLAALSKEKGVQIICLSLDYLHMPGDSRSYKQFQAMLTRLIEVAAILDCQRLAFWLVPGGDGWKEAFEKEFAELAPVFQAQGVKPLLRLGTPGLYHGLSLKNWRAMEPQDWRDLVSACPGLSLSFSPGDCLWLGIDYLQILPPLVSAIDHIEAHDVEINRPMLKDSGIFGPLWWRYRQIGKGQVDWGQLIEALKLYDYQGDFSIQLDDEFIDGDEAALLNALDDGIQKISPLLAY